MAGCGHDDPVTRACRHLLEREQPHHLHFVGRGIESELICAACITTPSETIDGVLIAVCAGCRDRAAGDSLEGIIGEPELRELPGTVRFEHRRVASPDFVELQPIVDGERARWLGVTRDGALQRWEADQPATRPIARLPDAVDPANPITMRISRDGRIAAIANRRGLSAIVIDVETGDLIRTVARDGYQNEHCNYSLAFLERGGQTLLVHAPAWNRLDVIDARTGALVTERQPTSYARDEERPEHYLDYFHGELAVSPGDRMVADGGWVWAPVGVVAAWSLDRWLDDNVWESEDGPSRRALCWRDYFWDGPMCWLDDQHLAVWGFGTDDQHLIAAVRVFDATTGEERSWFPGPRGELMCDRVLISLDAAHGTSLWDVARGGRIAHDPTPFVRYHPGAKLFVTLPVDGELVVGRPCGLEAGAPWATAQVVEVARAIARDRSFDELPVLGDALEIAGCSDPAVLAHCRHPGPHGDRCWVIDRLLPDP
ncbi:MAG: hypothetical protein WKG01_23080 [Kofleriaceae bacterium]